jgi:hypothetical protein
MPMSLVALFQAQVFEIVRSTVRTMPKGLSALAQAAAIQCCPLSEPTSIAQDVGPKKRKAEAKPARKSTPPAPKAAVGTGYPSCSQGILWVDSLCRLDDGRVCLVGEFDITGCK